MIVAGVMSSVPAVTRAAAAWWPSLPNGALVLPALDQTLDEESWNAIVPAHPEHPQFGLKKLLDALGVRREDVLPLPGTVPTRRAARARHADQRGDAARRHDRALAPVHGGAATRKEMAQALAGVTVLEAASAEDEAEAVA